MGDIVTILEVIRDEPAIWVAFLFTLGALIALWREWVVTGARHKEIVTTLDIDRKWWRERSDQLEQRLEQTRTERDQQLIAAVRNVSDALNMMLTEEQRSWLRRWIP